jgi:hypothetical protein
MLVAVVCVICLICGVHCAEGAPYLSRTDLLAAQLNVTIYEKDKVARGHIFVAPWSADDPSQPGLGPHIFKSNGDLIWSGYGSVPNTIINFMPIEYQGQGTMSFFEGNGGRKGVGFGRYRIIDNGYQTVKTLGVKDGVLHDFHEFKPTGPHTAVHTTYKIVPYDFSELENPMVNKGWVYDCLMTEFDTRTDETLFEWSALDHVDLDKSMILDELSTSGNTTTNAFDYFHINSIDKDDRGNYLVSSRHTWTLYYIDGSNGEIIWRLGKGKEDSDWLIDEDATFSYQHHARWRHPHQINLPKERGVDYLTLFDNESGSSGKTALRPHSRGVVLKLDRTKHTKNKIGRVSLVQEFLIPGEEDISSSQGSVQVLENGNFLIGWGSTSIISEHLPHGKPVFKASINSGKTPTYRAFKTKFKANSIDSLTFLSIYTKNQNQTQFYVSWNGATKVCSWNIYVSKYGRNFRHVKRVPKHGFETTYQTPGFHQWTKIEAISKCGKILGSQIAETYWTT